MSDLSLHKKGDARILNARGSQDRWELTSAEARIAEGLIRRHSLKEIAAQTNRSEKTVRNQCTDVYRKSGMTGRADLSAFFLNDVLGDDGRASDGDL